MGWTFNTKKCHFYTLFFFHHSVNECTWMQPSLHRLYSSCAAMYCMQFMAPPFCECSKLKSFVMRKMRLCNQVNALMFQEQIQIWEMLSSIKLHNAHPHFDVPLRWSEWQMHLLYFFMPTSNGNHFTGKMTGEKQQQHTMQTPLNIIRWLTKKEYFLKKITIFSREWHSIKNPLAKTKRNGDNKKTYPKLSL